MLDNEFVRAAKFRHSCRAFDANRAIPEDEFESLLEIGRIAPSSMGLEPTRMLVIRNKDLRLKLKETCWNQKQLVEASEVIAFISLKSDLMPNANYVRNKFESRFETKEELQEYINVKYTKLLFEHNNYYDDGILGGWVSSQAHIIATVMTYYAAFLKIDSCMIGGYNKPDTEKLLGLDTFKYQLSLILCLGYRTRAQKERKRLLKDEIITFI